METKTAQDLKDAMLEVLHRQLADVEPGGSDTYLLESFDKDQLQLVLDFVESFDTWS